MTPNTTEVTNTAETREKCVPTGESGNHYQRPHLDFERCLVMTFAEQFNQKVVDDLVSLLFCINNKVGQFCLDLASVDLLLSITGCR